MFMTSSFFSSLSPKRMHEAKLCFSGINWNKTKRFFNHRPAAIWWCRLFAKKCRWCFCCLFVEIAKNKFIQSNQGFKSYYDHDVVVGNNRTHTYIEGYLVNCRLSVSRLYSLKMYTKGNRKRRPGEDIKSFWIFLVFVVGFYEMYWEFHERPTLCNFNRRNTQSNPECFYICDFNLPPLAAFRFKIVLIFSSDWFFLLLFFVHRMQCSLKRIVLSIE